MNNYTDLYMDIMSIVCVLVAVTYVFTLFFI